MQWHWSQEAVAVAAFESGFGPVLYFEFGSEFGLDFELAFEPERTAA